MKRTPRIGVPLGPLIPVPLTLFNHTVRIPTTLLRRLVLRGAFIALLARLMGTAVLAAGGQTAAPLLPAWVVVMTAILVLVDLHRRRELALLHNLGITTSRAVMIAAVPALTLEAGLVMLLP